MIASDIDGTLLDYGDHAVPPRFNLTLLDELARVTRAVALVTNQGGLPFGVMAARRADGRTYPHPQQFVERVACLAVELQAHGIRVIELRVCVFHAKADAAANARAARMVRRGLQCAGLNFPTHVYASQRARKPSALMLRAAKAACYYGDSDEDAESAAGIHFVRVERFR